MSSSRKTGKKKDKQSYFFDYNLVFIIVFLMCFGLVMLYSASSPTALSKYDDGAYFLKKQIRNMLVGGFCMVIAASYDYRKFRGHQWFCYFSAIFLCLAVWIPGLGMNLNGSTRWIKLGPLSFQPSEYAKIAILLFCDIRY